MTIVSNTTMTPNHVSSPIMEQFEKKSERHVLACDLEIRARRMTRCFANITATLPLPNSNMRSAWDLLPNDSYDTTDKMPMPLKAGADFLRAPPSTLMDVAPAVVNGPSPRTRSHDIDWELIYETSSPTPDTTTFEVTSDACMAHNISSNPASEACPLTMDRQASVESNKSAASALPQSNTNHSCPPDVESSLVSQSESPVFARAFEDIVNDKIEEMRLHGLDFVVQSLLATGAQSAGSAPIVSMVVHATISKLTKDSATQAKSFEQAFRIRALEVFRRHWKLDGDWRRICSTSDQHSALTLTGVNKAGLMGSLFRTNVVTAEDIAVCLSILLDEVHFDRLCAMHAMLLHADDRLCKSRNLAALKQFREQLFIVDPVTNMYLWAPALHARALLQDIYDNIEGWMAIQANKRERFHESYLTRRQPPAKAVGPRLRQGRASHRP
ncbi:hypothetical protein K503DRAFT_388780 [Rhizopogon vinicolor AM-OR11-026]|uniref:Uncharacterized protein n=1 Tax=Rhizopogon vinicolor AM-OR11-026 TaxID=1314800 RepID=A0A1B7NBR4_9AGAM|nr:hypothetical protein K503DRAFT_388780 [Rhizopogon vinicolor AM-OR11-026]